ncbi:MAG TPA: GntR family transcriptional regulator [Steroidobacteraceae bacterium]|nr:GntR family transcriptional regulator [Steroidobacteraceae bacterium]
MSPTLKTGSRALTSRATANFAAKSIYNVRRSARYTLKDEVYAQICEALMSGEFLPGERLTVRRVAELTKTSVMPVREAFRRLASEGALEPNSSGWTQVPVIDSARLQEIVMLRCHLEGLAARLAARHITASEIAELESANTQMLDAIRRRDARAEARANEQFHFGIYGAARSPELLRIIESIWLRVGPVLISLHSGYNESAAAARRRNTAHHAALIEALRNRNAKKAEVILRQDLEDAADFYLSRAKKREEAGAAE